MGRRSCPSSKELTSPIQGRIDNRDRDAWGQTVRNGNQQQSITLAEPTRPLHLDPHLGSYVFIAPVTFVASIVVGLGLQKPAVILSYKLSDCPTQGDQSADTTPTRFDMFDLIGDAVGVRMAACDP